MSRAVRPTVTRIAMLTLPGVRCRGAVAFGTIVHLETFGEPHHESVSGALGGGTLCEHSTFDTAALERLWYHHMPTDDPPNSSLW